MKSYKILCTGNPNKVTIASGVRKIFPDADFIHLSNGYDLRLWDDERITKFVEKLQNYNVFINASYICHLGQYHLLNCVNDNWIGKVINIGSRAETEGNLQGTYHIEKNALLMRSMQIRKRKAVRSHHITAPGLNDGKPGHEYWLPMIEVAKIIKTILDSDVYIPHITIDSK